jgi:hypothetical protein
MTAGSGGAGTGAGTSASTGGSAATGGSASAGGSGSGGSGGGTTSHGTLIGAFTGVNGLIADSVDLLAPLGTVREYHNWGWICDNFAAGPAYPDMLYTYADFNGWDWDAFFSGLKAQGASGFPAVQLSVPWMNNSAVPPVLAGADKTLAASYVAHADAMFQTAARYGSVKVADALLKLKNNGQPRSSGLGTVEYFENFNEEDNAQAFTPDAMAAMCSADYDGDQKKLGTTFGVKNADPNAKLVMGGLSGAYPSSKWQASITTYLDGMRAWAAANRGGSFPADVVNVHYYSFGTGSGPAPSPEADGVKAKLAAVVAYRDQNLPGKEVWWTEFGYDTFATSPLHAPALGGNSAFIVQGQWLVRDFLAALAAGIDRATLFELDDTCNVADASCNGAQQFTTCGLVDGTGAKKAAWFFVAAFRARLATMAFSADQSAGAASGVSVYAFKDTAAPGGALVVWSPTSSAKVVTGFSLTLPSGATTAKAVTLADQQQNGVEATLTPAGGKVTLDVSETPTVVLVNAM